MDVDVSAELVSTIRPRHTAESWSGERLSSLTPNPTPSPTLKPPPGGTTLSAQSGGGRGLRGELRMRAGLETGERRVCVTCAWK